MYDTPSQMKWGAGMNARASDYEERKAPNIAEIQLISLRNEVHTLQHQEMKLRRELNQLQRENLSLTSSHAKVLKELNDRNTITCKTSEAAEEIIARLREEFGKSCQGRVESIDGTLAFLVTDLGEQLLEELIAATDRVAADNLFRFDRFIASREKRPKSNSGAVIL